MGKNWYSGLFSNFLVVDILPNIDVKRYYRSKSNFRSHLVSTYFFNAHPLFNILFRRLPVIQFLPTFDMFIPEHYAKGKIHKTFSCNLFGVACYIDSTIAEDSCTFVQSSVNPIQCVIPVVAHTNRNSVAADEHQAVTPIRIQKLIQSKISLYSDY